MRGDDFKQAGMWSYLSPEARVPTNHPLRPIRDMVDRALIELSPRFTPLYSKIGRRSIPPEQLLRSLVLQILYTLRSERLLMERLDHDLLFRWFVGLSADDPVWDVTVFTKNRRRLIKGEIAQHFLHAVLTQAKERGLLSDEHFSVDGTLIEAWAGHKSFKPKDGSGEGAARGGADFKGQRRSNETHESTTDPDARLYRKGAGQEARLAYLGHVLMENRSGLAVDGELTTATGTAERDAALTLMRRVRGKRPRPLTLGADKGYDTTSPRCAGTGSLRTSRRTRPTGGAPSTDAPLATPATP